MTEQAISPLRRRMIEDMAIRKLGAKTQHDYYIDFEVRIISGGLVEFVGPTTGCRLNSSMAAMMRSLSSCLDSTRMWRSTERASLEKKPSRAKSHA